MSVIDRVNATPLAADLLKRAAKMVGDLPPEDRSDLTARSLALIRFLDQEELHGIDGDDRSMVLTAIEFRMGALARLSKRPEFKAWTLQAGGTREPALIHEVLLEVAATASLIERNDGPSFEPKSFFQAALVRCEVEGRA